MPDKNRPRRVIVMGLGSPLLKDDGVGIHAIRKLQEDTKFDGVNVEIFDAGVAPDISVFLEGDTDKLIIIDAVQAHGRPGAIYRLTPDIFKTEKDISSLHNLDLHDSIALMRLGCVLPSEIVVIGIEPGSMDWGTELSPEVAAKFDELLSIIRREITL
jgi:hydrogenase maturation protease